MVLKCHHYKFNDTNNCNGSFETCSELLECSSKGPSMCFALAKLKENSDNETTILNAGCFPLDILPTNCIADICTGDHRPTADNYYCCCNKDNCNDRLTPKPRTPMLTTPSPETTTSTGQSYNQSVILFAVVVLISVFLGLYMTRKSRLNRKLKMERNNLLALANLGNDKNNQNRPMNNHQMNERVEPRFDLKDVELLELVGSGRFGTVHKANLARSVELPGKDENVDASETQQLITLYEIAVKIINKSEYQSFNNELSVYNMVKMRHPNILTFLGSCENPQTNSNWLLVEYASNGSLHHYLKENTVSWNEFLDVALGIVRGLSHLHDADVAHRDFKSKNVLLRHDLSPCITDFGVATILDMSGGSQTHQRRNYLQVGTPRYMAPEVLECSVAFTKISFTKIDVYALSLVLWELLSRCHPLPLLRNDREVASLAASCDEMPPYRLPFEDKVGSNPDINTMRQVVVCDKLRPPFRECWSYYPLSRMAQAIVDGWEYDHDARISASCFVERIESLPMQRQPTPPLQAPQQHQEIPE